MSTFVNMKWTKTQVERSVQCGQLIPRKIIRSDATKCQILRLNCTKFDFRWGSAADLVGGAYSAPTDHLAVFQGAYFWGKGGGRGKRTEEGQTKGVADEWQTASYAPVLRPAKLGYFLSGTVPNSRLRKFRLGTSTVVKPNLTDDRFTVASFSVFLLRLTPRAWRCASRELTSSQNPYGHDTIAILWVKHGITLGIKGRRFIVLFSY